jgi:hypothetical protein
MDNIVYEDDPCPDQRSRISDGQLIVSYLVFFLVSIILMYAFDWGYWIFDNPFRPFIIFTLPVIAMPWILVLIRKIRKPRKYQILDNRISILFKGPFHFDIPLDDIASIGIGDNNNIYIVKIRGTTTNLTPNNPRLFLENLNKAMNEWKRKNLEIKEESLYPDEEELE